MTTQIQWKEGLQTKDNAFAKELYYVFGGAILLSLATAFNFYLPFTPVQITLQNTLVLMIAAALGKRRGTLAVLLFLSEALCGLPVLSGFRGGIAQFFGPTGGYLIGYVVAAYVTGMISDNLKKYSARNLFLAMAAGNAVIYLFGVVWLSVFVGWSSVLLTGLIPFIPLDLTKMILSAKVLLSANFRVK